MKRLILLFAIIIVSFNMSHAVKPIVITKTDKQVQVDKKEFVNNLNLDGIMNMTPKSYEAATGKKMTFREKIGLKIAQKIVKRKIKKAAKKKRKQKKSGKQAKKEGKDIIGLLSMIFGILGIILFFLGGAATLLGILLGIAALVMGFVGLKGPNANKLYRILGIVFGGAIILFLLLAVIFIASLI